MRPGWWGKRSSVSARVSRRIRLLFRASLTARARALASRILARVEEGEGGAGHVRAEGRLDVGFGEVVDVVGGDALDADVAGDGRHRREGDATACRRPQAASAARLAEAGAATAGEDGGGRPLQRRAGRAADGVDVGVDAEQAAGADSVPDRLLGEADREELRIGDVAVLAVGDHLRREVDGTEWAL